MWMQETVSDCKLHDVCFQIDNNNENINTFSDKREIQIGVNTWLISWTYFVSSYTRYLFFQISLSFELKICFFITAAVTQNWVNKFSDIGYLHRYIVRHTFKPGTCFRQQALNAVLRYSISFLKNILAITCSKSTRTCEICSKLTIKTLEQRHWRCSPVFTPVLSLHFYC